MIITIISILAVIAVGIVLYMWALAHQNNIREHTQTLQAEGEDIKLFFISDTHLRKINKKMLNAVGKVDAVIIGGDFADKRTPIRTITHNLQLLQTLGPIYFIWGNNDREVGEEKLRALFKEYNVQIIANTAVALQPQLWLAAIDDTSTRNYSFVDALNLVPTEAKCIFVSHNPVVLDKIRAQYRGDILLAGHWHGGQIRLGKWAMRPNGSCVSTTEGMTLISNGYGTTLLPLRFGAKPECHIINIKFTSI